MKIARRAAADIADRLDLPAGVTRVTLSGRGRALIEEHRGLAAYTSERVEVRTALGALSIDGEGLRLAARDRDALLVTGRILSVTLS